MKVAVIGLGRMGHALAERLLKEGHQVNVWNRTPGRAGALQEQGAQVMGSADDIGDECDAAFPVPGRRPEHPRRGSSPR